ncbi:MAG TPA: DUF2066 domain-containing protein [Porticoccaceae bacterium]|nr:DUF2066 domain-containing protein [Porticoccaceae bacterium]
MFAINFQNWRLCLSITRSSLLLVSVLVLPPLVGVQLSVALQVTGLYSQQVRVSNESNAERTRAFHEALAAVIVKVTGDRDALQHPTIERALDNARNYVEAMSYDSVAIAVDTSATAATAVEPGPEPGVVSFSASLPDTIEQRYIDVDFSAKLINELLAGANIPVWDSNRPSVLIWMVLQNENGERSLLTADSNPEIIQMMQDFALVRGLPIIFPVLDFEDRQNLSADILWALDETTIGNASARYGADSVLSGRLHVTASSELVGLWQFIFQQQAETFYGFDTDLQSYLHAPLERITAELAGFFAIVPEFSNQQSVRLRIEGIKNLTAYSALLGYVGNLGLVESVTMAGLDGERLELDLGLLGDAQQLFELIALDRDLLPIESSLNVDQAFLHYRWTR